MHRFLSKLLCWALPLLAACGNERAQESSGLELKFEKPESAEPAVEYRAVASPFSATLGRLFANGRMVVLPGYAAVGGLESDPASGYAFSAIDGYGRLYHFYGSSKWVMGDVRPLDSELPPGGWSVAWNAQTRALEIMITAPREGRPRVALYRLMDRDWRLTPGEGTPNAGVRAFAALEPASGSWFFLSDDRATSLTLARLDRSSWDEIPAPNGPAREQVRWFAAYPPAGGLVALTAPGELWLWAQGAWSKELDLPRGDYNAFHYDPGTARLVLVSGGGVGRNVVHSVRVSRGATVVENLGPSVTPCDLLLVNDETQGVWNGLGRVAYSVVAGEDEGSTTTLSTFIPGTQGEGPLALAIETRQGGAYWEAAEIDSIEFAPQADSLLADRGAFVPSMGGYIEVSSKPSGTVKVASARFPFVERGESLTTETLAIEARATMRLRHSRLWLFEGTEIEWALPYPEIHPDLNFRSVHARPKEGIYDLLAWTQPDEGLIQYQYTRQSPNKVQWASPPVLTLRSLPEANFALGERFWNLDPVILGETPEIMILGWVGHLRPDAGTEGFVEVPNRGFFARASALAPDEWVSMPLPIPFTLDARLIADPLGEKIYFMGGRRNVARQINGRSVLFLEPNDEIWVWEGESWEPVLAKGRAPDLGLSFAAAFDSHRSMVLVLSAEGLFSFDGAEWETLWSAAEGGEGFLASRPGLKIHPKTGEIVSVWTGLNPRIGVWSGTNWAWIEQEQISPHLKIESPDDLRPLLGGGWAIASSRVIRALRDLSSLELTPAEEDYAWEVRFEPE